MNWLTRFGKSQGLVTRIMRRHILKLFIIYCVTGTGLYSAGLNTIFTGTFGAESNRRTASSMGGEPDAYLAPEASLEWVLPGAGNHLPKLSLDWNGNYYLESGNDQSFGLTGALEQTTGTKTWTEFLTGGYTEHTGSDDIDKPSNFYFVGAGGELRVKAKYPLKFKYSLDYIEEIDYTRWDIKNTLSSKVTLKQFKNMLLTPGLTFHWNYSKEVIYNYFGPSLSFMAIYMLDEAWYTLGFLNVSTRSYHNLSSKTIRDPDKNPGKFTAGGSGPVPTAGLSFLNVSLYRELTGNLDWVVDFLVFFNNYSQEFSEDNYSTARLGTGLTAHF